jgi:hypothetical protein
VQALHRQIVVHGVAVPIRQASIRVDIEARVVLFEIVLRLAQLGEPRQRPCGRQVTRSGVVNRATPFTSRQPNPPSCTSP